MPATPDTLATLLLQDDQPTIYAAALQIATDLGLPVTSWQPGDPTRSLFQLEAKYLEMLETIVVGYIGSGFLDYATGEWLGILAQQMFNVTVPPATFAETTVVLTNAGGGVYDFEPGDLTFSNSTSGVTFRNTTGGHLAATPGTLTLTVVADVAGAASTSGAGEIDTLVTTLLGVTCTNPTAAVGTDMQSAATTIQQCRNKLSSLSPNGPAGAYSFVALNPALTGILTVTQARVYPTSDTGDVLIYVAGPSGAVSGGDVTAVQNAINQWSTPLCITPTVVSANPVAVPVTYTLWLYQSVNQTTSQIQAAVLTALEALFAAEHIGGDIIPPAATGYFYQSVIEAAIGSAFPGKTFRVSLSLPSGDTSLANGDAPQLGTVTATVNLIPDP